MQYLSPSALELLSGEAATCNTNIKCVDLHAFGKYILCFGLP